MAAVELHAGIYARVSSADQRDRHTIESQLVELPAWAAAQGWKVVDTYVDDGRTAKSGHLEKRDGLARLLADAAAGRFSIVVVVDLDRFTRAEDLIERAAILGALQRAGVKVAIPGAGVQDLNTFAGDMYATLHTAFAAQWLRQHREKITRGKRRAISNGKKPAGPTPFGYSYNRTAPSGEAAWSIDEAQAEVVREIYRRVAAGETCSEIADDLTARGVARTRSCEWPRERVYAIVRAKTYLGRWVADKARGLAVPVPRIISDELWQAADQRLDRNKRRGGARSRRVYLLEKIARCELCGAPVGIATAIQATGTPARYLCTHRRRPPRGVDRCKLPYVEVDELDSELWSAIVDALSRPDLVDDELRRRAAAAAGDGELWRKNAAAARAKLADLDRASAVVLRQSSRGRIPESVLEAELDRIARDRTMAQHQLDAAERAGAATSTTAQDAMDLQAALEIIRPRLTALDPAERQALVRELLGDDAIIVGPVATRVRLGLRAVFGHPVQESISSVAHGQRLGVVTILSKRPNTGASGTDQDVVRCVTDLAQVPPPPYRRPARVVDGRVLSADGRPLSLRTCRECGRTFWFGGGNPGRVCSRDCAGDAARAVRWGKPPRAA